MSDWKSVKLGEVAKITMGQSPSSTTYNEFGDGLPFLQGCADFGPKYPIKKVYCSEPLKIAELNSVLISVRAPVGSLNIADTKYCIGRGLAGILGTTIDQTFLNYLISANTYKLESQSQGSTFAAINSGDLNNLALNVPESNETQRKIADILSTVDEVIEKTEAAIEKYQAIKAGMMQDLFTRGIDPKSGKLRPTIDEAPELYKESELGWIPKEWDLRILSKFNISIVDGDRGRNYPHDNELHEDGYCLFLNASNVTINGFEFSKMSFITKEKEDSLGSGKLVRNDVIVTTRGTVGNIAYYSDDILYEHMRINSGMLILRNCENGLTSEFLYLSLKNYFFDIGFKRVVSGSAQPQLPMKDLKSFLIIKPSQSEQKVIVDRIFSLDNEIEKEKCYLQKMSLIKQGLMADLLTGKVRVIKMNNKVENG